MRKCPICADPELSIALLKLAVRTLEYVGFEETDPRMECDREMRTLAIDGIKLLGLDPREEWAKHMRETRKRRRGGG